MILDGLKVLLGGLKIFLAIASSQFRPPLIVAPSSIIWKEFLAIVDDQNLFTTAEFSN